MDYEHGWRRSFWALIVTQFQGAFSFNAYQSLLSYIVLGMSLTRAERDLRVTLVPLIYAVPFLLFSMAGGNLADRYSKRSVTIITKIIEIAAMALAVLALASHSNQFTLAVLFLVATQAALFGPSKYGLLPEILPEKWLSWGNGILELGTFLAIIGGMLSAAGLANHFQGKEERIGIILLGLSFVGLGSSLAIGKAPPAAPSKKIRVNFLADLIHQIRLMRQDLPLFLAVLGNVYFW